MRRLAIALALLSTAAPARGQAPAEALEDLAGVLGQSQALRQACAGPADQFWRGRMLALIEAEQPPPELAARLQAAYQTGFAAARRGFPRCDAASRRAQADAAGRGHDLAAALSQTAAASEPPPSANDVADHPAPR